MEGSRKISLLKWTLFGGQFLLLFCILLYFPILRQSFEFFQSPPLAGATTELVSYELTSETWLKENYQTFYQKNVLNNQELKPLLLRARNQFLFDVFNKSANATIRIGKENYLFAKEGLQAYLGLDYIGEKAIQEKVRKLAFIQEHLENKGVKLLVFIPPSKASILPDKLPSPYNNYTGGINNLSQFSRELEAKHINQIQFTELLKSKHPEPFLYPKGGLHWSHVASAMAADTLRKRLEVLLGKNLASFQISGYDRTTKLRHPDKDLANTLNLSQDYPIDSMSYPQIAYVKDSLDYSPNVVVIGDSYYRMMFDMGFHQRLFSESSLYWHYFSKDVSKEFPLGKNLDRKHLDIEAVLHNKEVLLIEVGESNLDNFGFGFIEQFYEEISPE